tara:strand:- start:303 stop:584 length:282 start_codon:yes stop_codon:yes gene_type:complete
LDTRKAQFRIEDNGKHYIIDALRDEQGVARFWCKRKLNRAEVYVRGWMELLGSDYSSIRRPGNAAMAPRSSPFRIGDGAAARCRAQTHDIIGP